MYYFPCRTYCNLTDLIYFNFTSYNDLDSLNYHTNKNSSCNLFVFNLFMQMIDQDVDDITNVNSSIPSSLNDKEPVIFQLKYKFDSINPVFYKLLVRNISYNNSYGFDLGIFSRREFRMYEFFTARIYLKNITVLSFYLKF